MKTIFLYPLNLCRVTGKLVLLTNFRLMLSNHKCFGVHLYPPPPSAKTGSCVTLGIQGLNKVQSFVRVALRTRPSNSVLIVLLIIVQLVWCLMEEFHPQVIISCNLPHQQNKRSTLRNIQFVKNTRI